jgi:tetrahydromethanopterin S-methyltransferase subunit G
MSICQCKIDFITYSDVSYPIQLFEPRVNLNVYPGTLFNFNNYDYDIVLDIDHFISVRYCNIRNIKKQSNSIMIWLNEINKYKNKFASDKLPTYDIMSYTTTIKRCKISKLNRWTQLGCNQLIDMSEQRSSLVIDCKYYADLNAYGLIGKKYIIVNRGADPNGGGQNQTKIWGIKRYIELVKQLKTVYPNYLIVQIAVKSELEIEGVDIIIRDAMLKSSAVVLKQAEVVIVCEGGIQHLCAQLSVPCVVLFGPTPSYYYSYNRNCNIIATECGDCMGTTEKWQNICSAGYVTPICMESILPTTVLDKVSFQINKRDNYILNKLDTVNSIVLDNANKTLKLDIGVIDGIIIPTQINYSNYKLHYFSEDYSCGSLDKLSHNKFMMKCRVEGNSAKIGNVFNIPIDNESLDAIVYYKNDLSTTYEYFATKELLRVLKNSGILYIINAENSEVVEIYIKQIDI